MRLMRLVLLKCACAQLLLTRPFASCLLSFGSSETTFGQVGLHNLLHVGPVSPFLQEQVQVLSDCPPPPCPFLLSPSAHPALLVAVLLRTKPPPDPLSLT